MNDKINFEKIKGCKYCSGDYFIETYSIVHHTSDYSTQRPIDTSFCPNCGRDLRKG